MSATAAPSAAPPNSLRIWCDARYIYAELPSKPGAQVCVLSFSRDAVGLAKVLNLIYGHADNSGLMPENFHAGRKFVGTPNQHAAAEALLRRARIIK